MSASDAARLRLFETAPNPCNYLDGETSRTVVADPNFPLDQFTYTQLARHGFRRSGSFVYRPACESCDQCVPVRVRALDFLPRRSQRRVKRANADLNYTVLDGAFHQAHFDLYRRYQTARHGDGDMANHVESDYQSFLFADWCNTQLVEMRLDERLLGVAVLDVVDDGLSAVYSFFDPDLPSRSLGVQALLWGIDEVCTRGLEWLYLGYWIEACGKMSYKSEYLPQQRFYDGQWE
jgi:leucyl-tRNA---protein transferase